MSSRLDRRFAKIVLLSLATIFALFITSSVGYNLGDEKSISGSPLDLKHFRGVKDGPTEEGRTTDPTGRFDAVLLVESYGGAVGGVNWYVSIVQKSKPAVSATEAVFLATSAKQVWLSWRQAHLLEIHYQRAEILDFANLWSSRLIETNLLPTTKEPYWIEIRLAPSSPDFSILNTKGTFH